MTRPAICRPLIGLALTALAPVAHAQDVWDDPGGVETVWTFEGAIIAAPGSEEGFFGLARAGFAANYVLSNGVEIGAVVGVETQKDHPARDGFTGIFSPEGGAGGHIGAFSGLGRGDEIEDRRPRISLETGYVYVEGGYGEVRLGADDGVSTRFHESGPALFSHAGLASPALDPDGSIISRTDHDLTGPAAKLSYASPRILGLRGGVSYTPEADRRGLYRDPVRRLQGVSQPVLEDAYEVALNLSRRLPQSGVRLRAGAAYSQASLHFAPDPSRYGDVKTWSAGGSVEFSRLRLGGSYLSSNNGFAGGRGDYEAWSASAAIPIGKFELVAETASAADENARLESDSWQLGLVWKPESDWRIAGAWRDVDTYAADTPRSRLEPGRKHGGIVIEITHSL